MQILPVHTPPAYNPRGLLKPLAAALAGEGPAVAPYGGDFPRGLTGPPITENGPQAGEGAHGGGAHGTADIAAIVSTSGSTGIAKQTLLSIDALAASSMATAVRLRGEGQWLLALPVHYVAGLQVLVRSLFAGTSPEVVDLSNGFDPAAFTSAAAEMTDPQRYVSLVPTQLQRLLEEPDPRTMAVLRRFNAILLGGGPARSNLLDRAAAENLSVFTTYGMSETCGGCVYNGRPLEDVQIKVEGGQIWLGGPMVASGYLGQPELSAEHFSTENGIRWYRTDDLGELDATGQLHVLGRIDDVLITGGLKVSAAAVRMIIEELDGVEAAFVAGLDDAEWGTVVGAVVVADADVSDAAAHAVREALGPHAVPKAFLSMDRLPLLATGKPDRQRLIEQLNRSYVRDARE